MSQVIICDICETVIKSPAGTIKIDFRNRPSNSGGRFGNEFHSCDMCRTKLISSQETLWKNASSNTQQVAVKMCIQGNIR